MSVHWSPDAKRGLCGAPVGYLIDGWVSGRCIELVTCTPCFSKFQNLPSSKDALQALETREFVAIGEKL